MKFAVPSVIPLMSLVVLGVLFLSSTLRAPDWNNNLNTNWKKINIISVLIGFAYSMINFGLYWSMHHNIIALIGMVLTSAVLGFAFAQSVITDVKLRLVDRKMLFLSVLLSGLSNYGTMFYYHANYLVFLTTIYALVASVFILLPRLIGASDGRALLLITVGAFPLLSIHMFAYGICLMFISFMVYSFYFSWRDYRRGNITLMGIFTNKVSIPAVPIIIFPMMLMIIVGGLF